VGPAVSTQGVLKAKAAEQKPGETQTRGVLDEILVPALQGSVAICFNRGDFNYTV